MSPDGSDAIVAARHLAHRYGGEVGVVDVDVTLFAGRITGFLGRNGAGKSTTMKILAGVLVPAGGTATVVVDGVHRAAHTAAARRCVGWSPEEPAVHPALTVAEQLRFAARLRGSRSVAVDVAEVVNDLDLASVETKLCGSLSKGTRQRVGVAMALLGRPRVLLLDEPTAGLDPAQVQALRALLLRRRGDGAAILLSSHVTAEIEAIADDVTAIQAGRTVHHGDQSTLAAAVALVSGSAGVIDGAAP